MISAVIFDLDGLLADTEWLWGVAETDVLGSVGVALTPSMTKETAGLRPNETVSHWYSRYPWRDPSRSDVLALVLKRMGDLIAERCQARPGALEVLDLCAREGLPMAVASSSPLALINQTLNKLQIADRFKLVHSAEDEPNGKPHPGVFLTAAERLGIAPDRCLAFEDSPYGVLAAKAAKMVCYAVPGEGLCDHRFFAIADRVLDSLLDVTASMLRESNYALEGRG